jgi:Flp pilus assembly protein TadD/predicted DNA-binding protein
MSKKLLIAALSLLMAAPAAFGQEKLVKQVERMAKKDDVNVQEARKFLAPAFENPETANDARTWWVAGLIEEQQVKRDYVALSLGKEINEEAFYKAVNDMTDYYIKADSLDRLPNEKGKVKQRYDKKIAESLGTYYSFLVNGGAAAMDGGDLCKAHDYFQKYMDVKMDLFQGTPTAEQDSMSMQIGFFNAYSISQCMKDDKQAAIAAYEEIKDVPYRQNDVYQLLSQSYVMAGDTANFLKTLAEGQELFPEENFYLFNMINVYIQQGRNQEAKDYLDKAIASNPDNKQLYFVLANVYEQGFKDMAKAEEAFQKALTIDPEYAEAMLGLGRIYFNQGANIQSEANAITDEAEYQAKEEQAKEYFRKALPYFEKAVELNPDETQYLVALRGIYYNLGMDDKYNEIDQRINGAQ